ncbi:hypothetical protein AAVH_33107 [Aphelenchoides avenae]|nr:hypothetical protein AAVH_33107 [Aphelenchus avenae]
MASHGNGYRWLPLLKQAHQDLQCSNEEELRLKLLDATNKDKLLAAIKSRQASAPGKIAVEHVDGFDGPARTTLSKTCPQLTIAQQFTSANRELRFPDLPCLIVRLNDSSQQQHLPIETVMTRVDLTQRRLEPLPWMVAPPPLAVAKEVPKFTPPPPADRAEQIIHAIHETRSAVESMRGLMNRLTEAAETEAAFIAKNRQHLLNQVKRLEEDAKAKESLVQELKTENRHLQAALEKGTEDGYPTLSEAVKNAATRTPSTSEFEDLLTIADDEVTSSSDGGKAAARGKRKAAKAEAAPLPKKGNPPGTVA